MTCDSCGGDEEELFAVRRKYVTDGNERVLDDIEHWCFACCTHYPHEPNPTS